MSIERSSAAVVWSGLANSLRNVRLKQLEQLEQVEARISYERACRSAQIRDRYEQRAKASQDEQVANALATSVETRAANVAGVDFADRIITVCAVPFESPTRVEFRGEMWTEVFSRAAFHGLETHNRNIPVSAKLTFPAFDHVDSHLVGRVVSADPARSDGLGLDLRISNTPAGDETLELANDGALFPSVGFAAGGAGHRLDRRTMTRRVNRAFLDHVAMVPVPAYTGARVESMRSAEASQRSAHAASEAAIAAWQSYERGLRR
jgi:phage head maturation protease